MPAIFDVSNVSFTFIYYRIVNIYVSFYGTSMSPILTAPHDYFMYNYFFLFIYIYIYLIYRIYNARNYKFNETMYRVLDSMWHALL